MVYWRSGDILWQFLKWQFLKKDNLEPKHSSLYKMSEFVGNSSRAHESAVNRLYGELLFVWNTNSQGGPRDDIERQSLLDHMTGNPHLKQSSIKVAELPRGLPNTISELEAATDEDETCIKLVFRMFACWLYMSNGFGSAMNYLSAFKNILVRDVLGNESFFTIKHQHWYKSLRVKLKDAYIQRCSETGVPLFNPPDSFTRAQLVQMLATLLRNNVPLSESEELSLDNPDDFIPSNIGADKSIENAALLCLDFILLGRIAEIGALRWNKLKYDERFKVCMITLIFSVRYRYSF